LEFVLFAVFLASLGADLVAVLETAAQSPGVRHLLVALLVPLACTPASPR